MKIGTRAPADAQVLLTGISGFLAGHIALQLLEQGYRVRGSLRHMGKLDNVRTLLSAHLGRDALERLSFVEADLDRDEGWAAAVADCRYIIHTASPFPLGFPENTDELIRTAREGALRVLRNAHSEGVERVVLTSSIAATNHGDGQAPYTEDNWTDPNSPRATPYYQSKTVTEQAAWAYAREVGIDLAVINPSMILGPLLGANFGTSVGLIHHLMTGQFQGTPRFGFSVVDVRDAAQAHLLAMTHPAAKNHRFIVGGRFFWLKDLVAVLAASFPAYAARLPSGEVPDEVVRTMAATDPHARTIVHELNRDLSVSAAKAHHVLNWQSRSEEEAIRACAQSLIGLGLIGTVPPLTAARAS